MIDRRVRVGISALALSAVGFVSILNSEDYTEKAVIPIPGDRPTIGFGETQGVKLGDKTTPPAAVRRALTSTLQFESALKGCVKVPLYQYEYDAYVNLAYNIGTEAFCGSSLVRKLNALDYKGACAEIKRWDKFKGRPVRGLTLRREREYRQCLGL